MTAALYLSDIATAHTKYRLLPDLPATRDQLDAAFGTLTTIAVYAERLSGRTRSMLLGNPQAMVRAITLVGRASICLTTPAPPLAYDGNELTMRWAAIEVEPYDVTVLSDACDRFCQHLPAVPARSELRSVRTAVERRLPRLYELSIQQEPFADLLLAKALLRTMQTPATAALARRIATATTTDRIHLSAMEYEGYEDSMFSYQTASDNDPY
jgi:hypothetical protein